MKRFVTALIVIILVSLLVEASEKTVVYFFHSKTCSHCISENKFLDKIESNYPNLEIKRLEVEEQANLEIWRKMAAAYGTSAGVVPITFIGDEYILCYNTDEITGKILEEKIANCIQTGCIDPIEKIEETGNNETISTVLLAILLGAILVIGFVLIKLTGLI